eukprot:607986_1
MALEQSEQKLLCLIDETISYINEYPQLLLSYIKCSKSKNEHINIMDETKQIMKVLKLAFPTDAEATLIQKLTNKQLLIDSMVAIDTFDDKNKIVGFIATTKCYYDHDNKQHHGLALAPVAVHPQYQQNGIGSKLINTLIDNYTQNNNCIYMTVFGNPKFYNRFGFESAYKYNIKCKWKCSKEEKMILKKMHLCEKDGFMVQIFEKDAFIQPNIAITADLVIVHHAAEFDECP